MQILSGAFDHCVLQRGGDVFVTGQTEASGRIAAVLTKKRRPIARVSAAIRDGKFQIKFSKLPPGGPCELTFTAGKEQHTVRDILVGDIWICGGQSNMQGLGYLRHAERPHPHVRAFYMDDHWDIARDPLHQYGKAVDEVHRLLSPNAPKRPKPLEGVGPALSFALEMKRLTGVPQAVIPCAHGGSTLDQWSPDRKADGTRSLYGATLRRVNKNGGRVAGILWSQGESEAGLSADARAYTVKMVELVKAFRRDLSTPRLPIAMLQIARVVPAHPISPLWNMVQNQQRLLPQVIPHLAVVPSIDVTFDDDAHIGGDSNKLLGRRLAAAMHGLRGGKGRGIHPQITLRRLSVKADPLSWWGGSIVIAEFGNVIGKLVSAGRPYGFTIANPGIVYDTQLEGNRAIIRLAMPPLETTTLSLHYGQGTNPYCNITDQAGRSLPVFGPAPLGANRVLTAFAKPRVSQVFPSAGNPTGLPYPTPDTLRWHERPFKTDFCNIHDEFSAGDQLIYFACDVETSEPMKLVALFGYDGPAKLWIDGQEKFHDPHGTNPGVIDSKCIVFDAAPGQHEVLIALGSNIGKAWGIYLRFQRLDVSRKSSQLPTIDNHARIR